MQKTYHELLGVRDKIESSATEMSVVDPSTNQSGRERVRQLKIVQAYLSKIMVWREARS